MTDKPDLIETVRDLEKFATSPTERQIAKEMGSLLLEHSTLKACGHLLVIDLHRATELQLLSSDKSEKTLNEHDAAITALKERLK